MLYGSYPLDIYIDDIGLCVLAQDRALGDEVVSEADCSLSQSGLVALRLRDTVAYCACERELPVEQSQYSEIQRRIRHVAKCLYMRARGLIIIAIYNARVSAGAVKWQDKDRFDSCCTRNQPRHSIIVFIASQIPYNEIHFLTTSICTVIAA